MSDIFISYSKKDKGFADLLSARLGIYYSVWIDRESIQAGSIWEKSIEKAIEDCAVFLVLISSHSTASEWVTRECIKADRLKKHQIPILISGEIPFRFLHLQYIDFQGNFEGAFSDLIRSLHPVLSSRKINQDDIDRTLGKGVREYLKGRYSVANYFIAQALLLEPGLALSRDEFWAGFKKAPSTNWAKEYQGRIEIVEKTKLSDNSYPQGIKAYDWRISLDASPEILDKIEYVQYILHASFPNPLQIVRDRKSNFSLTKTGWGTFTIPATIYFEDGTFAEKSYTLQFV